MDLDTGYNLIDLSIIAILSVGFVLGLWKGFVRSLTALAALVFGVVLAMKYYPAVQPYLGRISSLDPQISMVISMVLVFIAVQVVFLVIRWFLSAVINLTNLSWLDRSLGALMGLAAGFVIAAAGVQTILVGVPEWPQVKQSKFIGPVNRLAQRGMAHLPAQTRADFESLVEKWKKDRKPQPSPTPSRPSSPQGSQGNPFNKGTERPAPVNRN